MTITADGGWLTAILLIGLLFVGIMAYRKRWPRARRSIVAFVGNSSVESQQRTEKRELHSSSHRPKRSFPLRAIVLWLLAIAAALYIILHIIPITGWIVDTFLHEVFGDKIVQPTTVVRQPVSVVNPPQVESPSYAVHLVKGTMPDWIRVPDGDSFVYSVDDVPDDQPLGMQCSVAWNEPPPDADGQEYSCDPHNIVARWFRPYLIDPGLKTATFRYHFLHS